MALSKDYDRTRLSEIAIFEIQEAFTGKLFALAASDESPHTASLGIVCANDPGFYPVCTTLYRDKSRKAAQKEAARINREYFGIDPDFADRIARSSKEARA